MHGGTWWDRASDGDESTATRLLYGFGCGLLPMVCAAQQGAQSASEATSRASARAQERVEEIVVGEAGGGGILGGLRESVTAAGEAAAAPLDSIGNIIKWYAISVGVLILAVLLGLFVWFVALPLAGVGGPKRAVA